MTTTAAEAPPSSSQGKARRLEPISRTINLLPTDSARLYTHIHPVIVLGCLYLFFPHLVNDPVTELLTAAVPLSLLQGAYCVICLPPSSGSSTPQSTPSKAPKRKRVQFAKAPPTVVSKVTTAAFSLFLTATLAVPLLTIILILFGAPFLTHFWHNILCATHVALLGVVPLFYVYGVNARIWREISAAALPFDEVWGGLIGAIVGAWLGAIPIPLDWDREWQEWPVTIVVGAYLGWSVFRLPGVYFLFGKRISFDE